MIPADPTPRAGELVEALAAALKYVDLHPVTLGDEADAGLDEWTWQARAILAAEPRLTLALPSVVDITGVDPILREARRQLLDELRVKVEGLGPKHAGESPGPNNWYFDGFEEASDAVLALLEHEGIEVAPDFGLQEFTRGVDR